MIKSDDGTTLPMLYHLNSEPWLNLDAYEAVSAEAPFSACDSGEHAIALPVAESTSAVAAAMALRRSCRRFAARSLDLELTAALLAGAYGVQGVAQLADGTRLLRRPVPSAGALYPFDLYLNTTRVEGVPDGIHRYHPLHHRLEPAGAPPSEAELAELLLAQAFVANANLLIFLTNTAPRTLRKYGPRGYRYLLLEAGHIAQALCMLASEAGLSTLCIGGFRDRRVNRRLQLPAGCVGTLYMVAIGWAEEAPGAP